MLKVRVVNGLTRLNDESFPIYEIENFLDQKECDKYIDYIKRIGKEQVIMNDANIIKIFNEKIRKLYNYYPHISDIEGYEFVSCSSAISLCMYEAPNKIGLHRDRIINSIGTCNLKKFFIYLNDDIVVGNETNVEDATNSREIISSGGTTFYNNKNEIVANIQRERGKAVIFNVKQLHEGAPLETGTKYLFGLRLLFKKIKK